MNNSQRVQLKLDLLRDCGHELNDRSMILDFGCGNGDKVAEFRRRGFSCYGCDLSWREGPNLERLRSEGTLREIQRPYRLPFDDATFDLVYSDQVLEHVRDHAQAFAELSRVLKPTGVCLHIFPSRYALIEPHVNVPLASWFRPYWWLRLWTGMGARPAVVRDLSAKEAALWNFEYLRRGTNYLTKADLVRLSTDYFGSCSFRMRTVLRHHPRGNRLTRLLTKLPLTAWTADTLHTHVLLQHK